MRLKHQFQICGAIRSNGDCLRYAPEFFMPCVQSVGAKGQVLDVEASVFTADGEVRVLEYRYVALHPRMDIAPDRDSDLLTRERLLNFETWRLRLVPLAIILRHGVNIVHGGISVDDSQLLIRLHRHDVRVIHATFLLERDFTLRRLRIGRWQGVRYVNHHVLETAARIDNHIFRWHSGRMLLHATWLSGHGDSRRMRRRSVELHPALYL